MLNILSWHIADHPIHVFRMKDMWWLNEVLTFCLVLGVLGGNPVLTHFQSYQTIISLKAGMTLLHLCLLTQWLAYLGGAAHCLLGELNLWGKKKMNLNPKTQSLVSANKELSFWPVLFCLSGREFQSQRKAKFHFPSCAIKQFGIDQLNTNIAIL